MERAFTEKFRRATNRFYKVALYLPLFILIVDSYFVLFMRLCLNAQTRAHLMAKVLPGVGSREIGISSKFIPITLQLALIGFFPLRILSFLKMPVN